MAGNIWDWSDVIIAGDEQRARNKDREDAGALRNLQMENMRLDMKERQGLQAHRAGWNPYWEENKHLTEPTKTTIQQPLTDQEMTASIGTGVGPITSKEVTTTTPAPETFASLHGKYDIKGGYVKEGTALLREDRLEKQGNSEGITKMLTAIEKLKGENQKNAIEVMRNTYPETKNWKFSEDSDTGIRKLTIPTPDGNWYFAVDGSGNKVAEKFVENKVEKEYAPVSKTLYGPGGSTKQVTIPKDGEYVPPKGWSLKEPSKPDKPDKPEYSPKQALARISTIDSTIARMKTTGGVDTGMAIQNPMLAGLVDVKDPEAVKQAITSLEQEKAYISQFAPKGTVASQPKPLVAPVNKTKEWKKWVK